MNEAVIKVTAVKKVKAAMKTKLIMKAKTVMREGATRRTISQFYSFKIRRTTFLNNIKFSDLLILRL